MQFTVDWISKRCHSAEAITATGTPVNAVIRFGEIVIQFLFKKKREEPRGNSAGTERGKKIYSRMPNEIGCDFNPKFRKAPFCLTDAT